MLYLVLLTLLPSARAEAQADVRARLALSYLQLELALAQAPELPPAERTRINREFDRTTLLFFGGNIEAALAVIDSLVESVAPAGTAGPTSLDARARTQLEALDGMRQRATIGGRDVAYLIRLPHPPSTSDMPSGPGTPERGWPVVVAVHGAGGDERMFFGGYGAGRIRSLADSLGIALITPAAPLTSAELFALVDTLATQYPLDPASVALLGHSMGAGIVARAAADRPERTRAVACIAGSCAAARAAGAGVPVKVVAGALDPLVQVATLEQQTAALREGERTVEFRRLETEGHTLVVGEALPDVMRWLRAQL